MAALPFDSARIEELVVRLNAVMAKEGTVTPDLGGNASDDQMAVTLQETEGDLSRDEITQEIESINDEQKHALVALFWIGSGDAEPQEWEANKTLARQRHAGLVSRYLMGKPMVGEYLTKVWRRCWNMVSIDPGTRPFDSVASERVAAFGWVFTEGRR